MYLFIYCNNLFQMESLSTFSKLALALWTQVIFLPQPPEQSVTHHHTYFTGKCFGFVFYNEPSVFHLCERARCVATARSVLFSMY